MTRSRWDYPIRAWLGPPASQVTESEDIALLRMAFILAARYCGEQVRPFRAIATDFSAFSPKPLSPTWVRQISQRGLRMLRHPSRHERILATPDVPPHLLQAIFGDALDYYQAKQRAPSRLT